MDFPKTEVKRFWNKASCGEELFLKGNSTKKNSRIKLKIDMK
jgi:hypothetical protein